MAKYVPSALIGRISRSAGATTFAHNRFGAYFRNRVIPTNPVTPAQTLVRGNLGTISSAWRALTAAQRAGWSSFGLNLTRTDSLGQTYTLTGIQAFVSINRELFTVGATAILSDAPAYAPPVALASVAPAGAA